MTFRNSPRSIKAVDLFCGAGGLTHGLIKSGIDVVAGVDLDPTCRYPFEANNKAEFVECDVANLDKNTLTKFYDSRSISLLAGCAPCHPFSTYSRKGRSQRETDWALVHNFGELVKISQPDLVTMENVSQLADHQVFDSFLEALDGYSVDWSIVECSDIGVPQSRKRLVLLASRLSDEAPTLTARKRLVTVRRAIGRLPKLTAGGQDLADPLHMAPRLSDLNMRRIKASKPGGSWRDWPKDLLADCHLKDSGSTYPSVYGRMEWDKVGPTMTTQSFGYGNGRFGHPEQHRAISLREAAMLQTFPRTYKFVPKGETVRFNNLGRLIGNAVPVRLGEEIGKALIKHVEQLPAVG